MKLKKILNWFKVKPEPKLKPTRVAVHCCDGTTVVHYAIYRTLRQHGGLSLHNDEFGKQVVAEYAAGVWSSVTSGTRKVSAQ